MAIYSLGLPKRNGMMEGKKITVGNGTIDNNNDTRGIIKNNIITDELIDDD